MIEKRIQNILAKFIVNQATNQELEELHLWLEDPKNERILTEYIKINYAVNYNIKKFNALKTRRKLSVLQNESTRFKTTQIKKYFKYAAVLVGVYVTIYVLKTNPFENQKQSTTISKTLPTPIEPGTNKATLTLEDGSSVVLEKGQATTTKNAKSNGSQLIYESTTKPSTKTFYNTLTIPRGGEFYVVLSDGTKVWLNAASQLKYPITFKEGTDRIVELVYGEAYFEVSPSTMHNGARFKVINQSQEVEVLGTKFNVKAYPEDAHIYTTIAEGKVAVGSGNQYVQLRPGEQSDLDKNNKNIQIATVNVANEISWKNGMFVFEGKSLKEITEVLSRWYDVDFVIENSQAKAKRFNGSLKKSIALNGVLDIIKESGIINHHKINDKTIVLE